MTWWLLWVASHSQKVWVVLLAAFAYAHLHNTLFSLLHEAVHGVFAPKESTNELFGVLSATAFPASAEGISYAIISAQMLSLALKEDKNNFLPLYHRNAKPLKKNIDNKMKKYPTMYNKTIRKWILTLGIGAMDVRGKGA